MRPFAGTKTGLAPSPDRHSRPPGGAARAHYTV